MEKTKFKISVTKHGSNAAYYRIYTNRKSMFLFSMMDSNVSNVWYFDVPENDSRMLWYESEDGKCPVDFLLDLCKSVLMVRYGYFNFEVELTAEAKRLLKIK